MLSHYSSRALLSAVLFCSGLLITGCQTATPKFAMTDMTPRFDLTELPLIGEQQEEEPYQRPERMVVIWSPDVFTQPGKKPTRGFGGRIYFYNNKNRPTSVDGQLVVYAFDDTHQEAAKGQPDRRFVFTPEQFTRHFSQSELGASYSVWIPWDHFPGPEVTLSLLPIFTDVQGQRVVGQQTTQILTGLKGNAKAISNLPRPGAIQRVGHHSPSPGHFGSNGHQVVQAGYQNQSLSAQNMAAQKANAKLRSTTIPVSGKLSDQLLQPQVSDEAALRARQLKGLSLAEKARLHQQQQNISEPAEVQQQIETPQSNAAQTADSLWQRFREREPARRFTPRF